MTHSIASAKCPNVLSSGNYGMSQNRYTDDTKEYIFVKLTDSAYRAIEEYQRNDNAKRFAPGQRAKIQFIGNSGVIHFPLPNNNSNNNNHNNSNNNNVGTGVGTDLPARKFGFAIDEIEGSLECMQQEQHELNVLGSLALRMRIHANEDVYDTTRTKMAIAEETEKSKCIREIKPNQSDIGRKVKRPGSALSSMAAFQSNQHQHYNGNNSGNNSSSYISNSNSRSKLVSSPLNGLVPSSSTSSLLATTTLSTARSPNPNPTTLGGSGTINNNNNNNSNSNINRYGNNSNINSSNSGIYAQNHSNSSSLPNLTTASSLSSALAGGIAHGYAALSSSSPRESASSSALATNRIKITGNGNTTHGSSNSSSIHSNNSNARGIVGSNKNNNVNNSKGIGNNNLSNGGVKMPDVSRRKIKERLIHLLALKNFKKPELYSRLQSEGLRDRERTLIGNILKDISTLSRDNTYNLRRQMWNDVDENWPFFTEQEKQQLKRRKPQNLTPPMSSDAGSSTSGQSPTSTHTGSPPPLVVNGLSNNNGGINNLKRPSLEYDDAAFSGATAKKQRISHYKKDSSGGFNSNSNLPTTNRFGNNNNNNSNSNSGNSNSNNNNSSYGNRPSYVQNQQRNDDYGSNSGHNDLSYNVLDNVEFLANIETQSNSSVGNNTNSNGIRKLNNNVNVKQAQKEKRSSAGSNSSGGSSGYETLERRQNASLSASSSSSVTNKKQQASSAIKSTYGNSFVPETKACPSGSGSRSFVQQQNQQQQQQPQQQQQQQQRSSSSNSVIYPSKATQSQFSPRDEYNLYHSASNSKKRTSSSNNINNNNQNHNNNGQRPQHSNSTVDRSASSLASSNLLNKQQSQQHQKQQKQLYEQQEPPKTNFFIENELPQDQDQDQDHEHEQQYQQHQQQQIQQQEDDVEKEENAHHTQRQRPSPTQELAAAVHSYASANSLEDNTSLARFKFTEYTPIMTLEERRHYKTEFENDYDEYCKLLSLVENVRKRFQELAERLEMARKRDTGDYNHIKQQIVCEYERITNEENIRKDKLRFDYLHSKLAHIKQLVTDYDRALTAGAQNSAVTTTQTTTTTTSSVETQNSRYQQQQQQQQQQHHQQEQQQYYQQYHAAETIQQQQHQQSSTASSTADDVLILSQQQQQQQQAQVQVQQHIYSNGYNDQQERFQNYNEAHNSNRNESDSEDSSDSSDSNDEQDIEDSNSEEDDDDDDDNDENDDNDNDEHY